MALPWRCARSPAGPTHVPRSRARRSRPAGHPMRGGRRPRRAGTAALSLDQLSIPHHGAPVELYGALAQRQVEVPERMPSRDLVGASRIEEVAGEGALLGSIYIAPVVHGERVPACARIEAPADVRDRVRFAVAPSRKVLTHQL